MSGTEVIFSQACDIMFYKITRYFTSRKANESFLYKLHPGFCWFKLACKPCLCLMFVLLLRASIINCGHSVKDGLDGPSMSFGIPNANYSCPIILQTKRFNSNRGHVKFSHPVSSAAAICTTAKYRCEDRQNVCYIHSGDRMTETI